MRNRTVSSWCAAALFACALTLLHGASLASALYSGTIAGIFTDPVLSGVNINPDGSTSALDNTGTALAFVSGVGTNHIAWGDCDVDACGAVPFQSVVAFSGEPFADVAPGVVFKLGTLSYLNGTSLSTTLIFGATLTVTAIAVDAAGIPVAIDPAITQMSVWSTVNGGDRFANADFLAFDVLPHSFHVFEGQTAVADIHGYIQGGLQLVFGTLSLPPDQAGNGFLLPEPGNMALLGLGLAILGLMRRN